MTVDLQKKTVALDLIKSQALALAKLYGGNIKIEVDVNPAVQSAKVKITEFVA